MSDFLWGVVLGLGPGALLGVALMLGVWLYIERPSKWPGSK